MALCVLISFSTRLRPSEWPGRWAQSVAKHLKMLGLFTCPEDRLARTKVGAKDDTVQLDSLFLQQWIDSRMAQLFVAIPTVRVCCGERKNIAAPVGSRR